MSSNSVPQKCYVYSNVAFYPLDRNPNGSLGYGFVTYTNPGDAERAIQQLNGKQMQHKTIKVRTFFKV